MVIKPVLLAALEKTVNAYLAALPESGNLLKPIAGQLIKFTITPYGVSFYINPTRENILFLPDCPDQSDVSLTGNVTGFIAMALAEGNTEPLFAQNVSIDGDTALAQRFQHVLSALKIDWPLALSRYTGPVLAGGIESAFHRVRERLRETTDSWAVQTQEWLQEEAKTLPTRLELEQWYDQVDELRGDVERLDLRLNKITRQG
ncbi:MAG: SCP2 sterol-binding domain-containing protein [Methylococcales bacterium]|nr:SCP2 sterol-binding domain-containing protein [Methylococcales bacterium]